MDETHYFAISKSVEYFVKFEVPEHLTEKYNAEPQKHIFQVCMPSFSQLLAWLRLLPALPEMDF